MRDKSVNNIQRVIKYFVLTVFFFCISNVRLVALAYSTSTDDSSPADAQLQQHDDTLSKNAKNLQLQEETLFSDIVKAPLIHQHDKTATDNTNKKISKDVLGNLLNQLDDLQQEIRTLKGELEVQAHLTEQLKLQCEKCHEDINTRLSRLEARATSLYIVPSDENKKDNKEQSVTSTDDNPVDDVKAYQYAFKLTSEQKFKAAVTAFNNFIVNYPKSQYISHALFWLGEIYSAIGEMEQAGEKFLKIVNDYPNDTQRADAMYKLGIILAQSGDKEKAKIYLQQVIKDYPDSSVSDLSKKYLKVLN